MHELIDIVTQLLFFINATSKMTIYRQPQQQTKIRHTQK